MLLPLSALLVAALIAGLTWAVSSRSPHSPQVLRLLGAGSAADAVAPARAATTPESGTTQTGAYRLTGELPSGHPADAPVYTLAGPYDTSRLAKALSREGLTTQHASWWWSSCTTAPAPVGAPDAKPAEPVPNSTKEMPAGPGPSTSPEPSSAPADDPVSSCAVSSGVSGGVVTSGGGSSSGSGTTEPAPPPEPTTPSMSDLQARDAAHPVFAAVDLSITDAHVSITPYGASVWVDPVVNGLPTSGYTTRVELNQDRQITWASGFLGDPARGDSYPLVPAREAFDAIPIPPAMDMMCPVTPDGKGCLPPVPPEITGAVLGLDLRQTSGGDQVLVPAWLFDVKGSDQPLGQIAIAEKYLGNPEPTAEPGTGKGTTTDPGQSEPGSSEPVPPVSPKG